MTRSISGLNLSRFDVVGRRRSERSSVDRAGRRRPVNSGAPDRAVGPESERMPSEARPRSALNVPVIAGTDTWQVLLDQGGWKISNGGRLSTATSLRR